MGEGPELDCVLIAGISTIGFGTDWCVTMEEEGGRPQKWIILSRDDRSAVERSKGKVRGRPLLKLGMIHL